MSWDAVLNWGLETGLMIAALIAFVLIVRRPVAKFFGAKAAYALWLLPSLRLIMPNMSIPNVLPVKPASAVPIDVMMELTGVVAPEQVAINWTVYVLPSLALIWACGVVIYILYQILAQAEMADRLAYESDPASPRIKDTAAMVAKQMGFDIVPRIRVTEDGAGPLVCQLSQPTIYLPFDFEARFTPTQQRFALMHEMAHIKRRDLWAAWAWLIFRALNWPNPLVHFASRAFRADQEAACDATVMKALGGEKQTIAAYAETLLRAAQIAAQTGRASPAHGELALTIHQPLKERLIMLKSNNSKSGWLSRIAASALIISAFGLTAPLSLAENHPEEELAGKSEKHVKKSVMKFVTNKDSKETKRHIEISVDGDKVTAFEIDEDGNKTSIDPDDIEEIDIGIMGRENVFALSLDKNEFAKWRDGEFKEWKEGDFAKWAEKMKDGKGISRTFTFKSEDGAFEFPHPPSPPNAPHILRFHQGGMSSGSLRSDGMDVEMRLRSAEGMLEAAEDMIREAEKTTEDSRKIAKAKRSLDKARKALKEAERALRED